VRRIGAECGRAKTETEYSLAGRIPLTARHYLRMVSRYFLRALSENILMIGKLPEG